MKRLDQALPNLNIQQRTAILGAAAVAAYHAEKGVAIVDTLVCDDAAMFHWLTRAKKTSLLLVLQHPELPLHNHASELAVRQRVRKRDVSFGPRTQLGLQAWDTFITLADTARKLGLSFYAYIRDRVSGINQIPPMSLLVTKRARELNLSCSWG